MTDLALQQCKNYSSNDFPLKDEQTSSLLQNLNPQWALDNSKQSISHTYNFKDYFQTISFVNIIAKIAHQQNHHPDLLVSYNRCQITFSTHSVGGLTTNDFICAAIINNTENI